MLITQTIEISRFSIADDIAGLVGYRYGSGTSLTFGEAFDYGTLEGSGLAFDSLSQTWSGTVSRISFYNNIWSVGLNVQRTSTLTFSTPVSVSALSASETSAFFQQLMNAPGNTNNGTGTAGDDTFAGSVQQDSFNGGDGLDVVDYRFATLALAVDLSGAFAPLGAAVDDVLTGIEGIRGTSLGDTLRGSSGANLLDGAGGNDFIFSSTGNDTLAGGTGWDEVNLLGVAGNLLVSTTLVTSSASAVQVKISGFESYVTGGGNDTITGQDGNAQYITNAGADLIKLIGTGQKTVLSGSGDDTVELWGLCTPSLTFGDGRDTLVVNLGGSTTALTVTMTDIGSGTFSGRLTGTFSGLDVLTSANAQIVYYGHAGRDEVQASIGNDVLYGANGDDYLVAGNGNDLIFGDSDWGFQGGSSDYGSDSVSAGGGNDTIHAANGNDTYSGGGDWDVLSYRQLFDDYGNGEYAITLNGNNSVTKSFYDWYGDVYSETDTILVGAGDDIEEIVGTVSGDTFYNNAGSSRSYRGDAGADIFWIWAATSGETVLDLGLGADVLRVRAATPVTAWLAGNWTATSASDTIGQITFETRGFDISLSAMTASVGVTLRNTSATDGAIMVGTAHADRFESASMLDEMHGGAGSDTYVVTAGLGFPMIHEDYGAAGLDEIITSVDGLDIGDTIENVTLLDGAVVVRGNPFANHIKGNDAGNTIWGEGGADTLEGGKGSDTYHVIGSEVLIEAPYFAPYYDSEFGWVSDPDRDLVIASVNFTMTITGIEDLTLAAGARNGTGNLQGNAMTGNAAANVLRGGAGNDSLVGGGGNDSLWGGTENDRLRGDAGADSLRGDAGNDSLLGGDGADVLTGGAGANRLTGGRGADQFQFGTQAETTVITDFMDGLDKLAFAASTARSETFILNRAAQDGADVVISIPLAGLEIRLVDTTVAALAGDILIL